MILRPSAFRRAAAFTMVEIALCLAIVGFALVAIIGVLPAGLNVQKENREDTIINQDATVLLNAIRNADRGADDLTNFVERITVSRVRFDPPNYNAPTRLDSLVGEPLQRGASGNEQFILLNSGANIIGLLSTPKYQTAPGNSFISNHVSAYFRAFSGSASERVPRNHPTRELAFGYRFICDVTPPGLADYYGQYNSEVGSAFSRNLTDIRLVFAWPLIPPLDLNLNLPTNTGTSRLIFRTQVGGSISAFPISGASDPGMFFWFLNADGTPTFQ